MKILEENVAPKREIGIDWGFQAVVGLEAKARGAGSQRFQGIEAAFEIDQLTIRGDMRIDRFERIGFIENEAP